VKLDWRHHSFQHTHVAKPKKKKAPRGQGGGVTRGDMMLTRKALRGDWPISTRIKTLAYGAVVAILEDKFLASDRTKLMAARTLALFAGITLRQAVIDLRREKQEGRQSDVSLADLVGEAEQRAEARRIERAGEK
jgi:hypothetical protein